MRALGTQQGLSLISTVISLGVMTTIAVGLARVTQTQMQAQKRIDQRYEVIDAAKFIRDNIDCKETVKKLLEFGRTVHECIAGSEFLPLYRGGQHPGIMVRGNAANPTYYGKWVARPRCTAEGIAVDFSMPIDGAPLPLQLTNSQHQYFAKDPLTGKILNWANSPPGFTRPLCTNEFQDTPPTSPDTGNRTPFDQCRFFQKDVVRTSTVLGSDNRWRIARHHCPNEFPVLVSATVNPACNAMDWIVHSLLDNSSQYPRTVSCNIAFFQDADLSASQKATRDDQCAAQNMDPEIGQCNFLCCRL